MLKPRVVFRFHFIIILPMEIKNMEVNNEM